MPMRFCEAPGCTYSVKEPYLMRQHMRQHTGERPYVCTKGCNATFTARSGLVKHEQVHANPHFVCPEPGCGYLAATTTALASHRRKVGHCASPFECPFPNCGAHLKSYGALLMHKRGPAHAGEGGKSVCNTCSAVFDTVAEYTAHQKQHRMQRLQDIRARQREKGAEGGAGGAGGAGGGGGGGGAGDEGDAGNVGGGGVEDGVGGGAEEL